MGIDSKMDVQLDVSSAGYAGRLEVLEGPTGRRIRTKVERARIAAESLMPGIQIAEIARKYGTTRWQIYDWRRRLRRGELTLLENGVTKFAPLKVEEPLPEPVVARTTPAQVEITIGDMVVRTSVEVEQLSGVIRAIRLSR